MGRSTTLSCPRVVRRFSCDHCGRNVEEAIALVGSNAPRPNDERALRPSVMSNEMVPSRSSRIAEMPDQIEAVTKTPPRPIVE